MTPQKRFFWERHIRRYFGDYRTQYLLAQLCCLVQVAVSKPESKSPAIGEFAPWFLSKKEFREFLAKADAPDGHKPIKVDMDDVDYF